MLSGRLADHSPAKEKFHGPVAGIRKMARRTSIFAATVIAKSSKAEIPFLMVLFVSLLLTLLKDSGWFFPVQSIGYEGRLAEFAANVVKFWKFHRICGLTAKYVDIT